MVSYCDEESFIKKVNSNKKIYQKLIASKILEKSKEKIEFIKTYGSWSRKLEHSILETKELDKNLEKLKEYVYLKNSFLNKRHSISNIKTKVNRILVENSQKNRFELLLNNNFLNLFLKDITFDPITGLNKLILSINYSPKTLLLPYIAYLEENSLEKIKNNLIILEKFLKAKNFTEFSSNFVNNVLEVCVNVSKFIEKNSNLIIDYNYIDFKLISANSKQFSIQNNKFIEEVCKSYNLSDFLVSAPNISNDFLDLLTSLKDEIFKDFLIYYVVIDNAITYAKLDALLNKQKRTYYGLKIQLKDKEKENETLRKLINLSTTYLNSEVTPILKEYFDAEKYYITYERALNSLKINLKKVIINSDLFAGFSNDFKTHIINKIKSVLLQHQIPFKNLNPNIKLKENALFYHNFDLLKKRADKTFKNSLKKLLNRNSKTRVLHTNNFNNHILNAFYEPHNKSITLGIPYVKYTLLDLYQTLGHQLGHAIDFQNVLIDEKNKLINMTEKDFLALNELKEKIKAYCTSTTRTQETSSEDLADFLGIITTQLIFKEENKNFELDNYLENEFWIDNSKIKEIANKTDVHSPNFNRITTSLAIFETLNNIN